MKKIRKLIHNSPSNIFQIHKKIHNFYTQLKMTREKTRIKITFFVVTILTLRSINIDKKKKHESCLHPPIEFRFSFYTPYI